jgi:selenoprotein W-related protein
LAAKLDSRFVTETLLVEGAGGVFDVVVDGKLVYSKHQTGEFPDQDKLISEVISRRM